jgi:hypothetical protein
MEVHLPDTQESQLNGLAARTGRGTDELVQEAVARLLAPNVSGCSNLEAHTVGARRC